MSRWGEIRVKHHFDRRVSSIKPGWEAEWRHCCEHRQRYQQREHHGYCFKKIPTQRGGVTHPTSTCRPRGEMGPAQSKIYVCMFKFAGKWAQQRELTFLPPSVLLKAYFKQRYTTRLMTMSWLYSDHSRINCREAMIQSSWCRTHKVAKKVVREIGREGTN